VQSYQIIDLDIRLASRIATVSDYIFGQSSITDGRERSGQILQCIRGHMASFLSAQRIQFPTRPREALEEDLPTQSSINEFSITTDSADCDALWESFDPREHSGLLMPPPGTEGVDNFWYSWPLSNPEINAANGESTIV
jgi:hypothetical protein